jgi:hypothetical protein
MLTDEEKKEVVAKATTVLRGGEFVDASLGTVMGGMLLPSFAVRKTARFDDVQIDGSFNGKHNIIWMDIRVGDDQIYREGGSAAWTEVEPHEDKWVRALEVLRRHLILEDLSDV